MDAFTIECRAIPAAPRLLAFRGEEELARPFDYQIFFTLDEVSSLDFTPEDAIGAHAALRLGAGPSSARLNGAVAEIELLEEARDSVYRLRLVPELWFLGCSAHSRVFVERSTPEIIGRVLGYAGIPADAFEVRLTGSYSKREHVCQYEESDLDFLHRSMEREGIYYYFDHAGPSSKLVIVDGGHPRPRLRREPLAYHPHVALGVVPAEHARSFRASVTARPKDTAAADYNYLTPDVRIRASAAIAPGFAARAEHWGENDVDPPAARRTATIDAQRQISGRERYFVVGSAVGIHPGFLFDLSQHPVGNLNRSYLAVRVIQGWQAEADAGRVADAWGLKMAPGETHRVEVEAVASDAPFRPPRRTPVPRAFGLELARVDGPATSDYAQLDDEGRYLVRLMMDEIDAAAGGASTRVRLVQPHAGAPEGLHLPLRKGTEVLLAFVGGDPDRPVIAGGCPNAVTPSRVTSANHTHNVLVTGGRSRIDIDDLEGSQYVDISTPPERTYVHLGADAGLGDHNVVLSTDGDALVTTEGNQDIVVGGTLNEDVRGAVAEMYQANVTRRVSAARVETIDAAATDIVHAGLQQTVSGGATQAIDGGETDQIAGGMTESIHGAASRTIAGTSTETTTATRTQTIAGGATLTSGGAYTVSADGPITLTTDGPMTVLTNSWHMQAPGGQVTVDATYTTFADAWTHRYDWYLNLNGLNVAIGGVNLEMFGARFDAIAWKCEYEAILLQTSGFKQTEKMWVGITAAGLSFGLGFLVLI
jgi:type VI secretion system secreted protein VgrG